VCVLLLLLQELRNSKKKLEPVPSAVVTLSLDNVTHTTACAKDVLAPTWEQSFLFAVNSELGNAMKVKLYDESKVRTVQ
jgi:Ca2+-dependent lipid-binding protein